MKEEEKSMKIEKSIKMEKLQTAACFLLALAVVLLNFSLAFDHVVWGDEAFSANTISGTSAFGIFQKIFYWDSHPPLYYYWLKLVSLCFGECTFAYHLASLIPFTICIVLALFPLRKKTGTIPVMFFVTILGLSEVTSEYNLEIRMYSLCFLFIFICVLCTLYIWESEKLYLWVIMTLAAVCAAYTHYFGLVVAGILLFYTGLFYFLKKRGTSWKRGLTAITAFVLLYAPWLYVFARQLKTVSGKWWLSEIQAPDYLLKVVYCGEKLFPLWMTLSVFLTICFFINETKVIYLTFDDTCQCVKWHVKRPVWTGCSKELQILLWGWCIIVSTLGFTYIASFLINSLTVDRYMYPLIPISLVMLVLQIKSVSAYAEASFQQLSQKSSAGYIHLFHWEGVCFRRVLKTMIYILYLLVLVICLFDFKYYRSRSKTEELFTKITLDVVGEPNPDAVMIGNQVKHLSWTVLYYYYPDHQIEDCSPDALEETPSEIWAFLGYDISDETAANMEQKGYQWDYWEQMWVGKYECRLYHFYQ